MKRRWKCSAPTKIDFDAGQRGGITGRREPVDGGLRAALRQPNRVFKRPIIHEQFSGHAALTSADRRGQSEGRRARPEVAHRDVVCSRLERR